MPIFAAQAVYPPPSPPALAGTQSTTTTTKTTVEAEAATRRRRAACRCLFSNAVDEESNDQFVKRLLDEMRDEQTRKWGYDFDSDAPLMNSGEFVYERIAANCVPGFYRMSSLSPESPSAVDKENSYYSDPRAAKYLNASGIIFDIDEDEDNDNDSHQGAHKYTLSGVDDSFDAENMHSKTHRYSRERTERRACRRILNGSCDDIELSFDDDVAPRVDEDEDDVPLLNDSTSSSGSSVGNEFNFASATASATAAFAAPDNAESSVVFHDDASFMTTTTYATLDVDEAEADDESTVEELLLFAKRTSAVTPKKQSRLTEFMARRKSLQWSVEKSGKATATTSAHDSGGVLKSTFAETPSNRVVLVPRRRRVDTELTTTPVSSRCRKRAALDDNEAFVMPPQSAPLFHAKRLKMTSASAGSRDF